MNKRKFGARSFAGKGYYIALILCAVAIGISGYLYYRHANPDKNGGESLNADSPNVEIVATEPTQGTTQKPLKTGLPLSGETVVGYAMDTLCYNPTTRDWRVHDGIDIAAEAGSPVCAAAEGTVYTTYQDDTMGATVVIRHDGGYVTTYASLDDALEVKTGDVVKLGQTIGYVSRTAVMESAIGDHVHFSVSCNDESVDPLDFCS